MEKTETNRESGGSQKYPIYLLVAGILLAGLALWGFSPLEYFAARLSPDGDISAAFSIAIKRNQLVVGILLIIAAPLFSLLKNFFLKGSRKKVAQPRDKTFVLFLALLGFIAALSIQSCWFERMPHVTDGTSHEFQARILNSGHLTAPLPDCPEHFWQHNTVMLKSGQWFTIYPLGTAAWLLWGVFLGLSWLPIPLAFACSIPALFSIIRYISDSSTARWTTFLYTVSPLSILLGASFMSHTPFIMFALMGLAVFLKAFEKDGKKPLLWMAGASLGMAFLCRPPDFVFLGLTLFVGFLLSGHHRSKLFIKALHMLPGFALPLLLQMMANNTFYGSPFSLGYGATSTDSLVPIISYHWGLTADFPLQKAALHWLWEFPKLNRALFGWPTSFLFVILFFILRKPTRADVTMLAGTLGVFAFFFFYNYPGFEYEARLYLVTLPMLAFLSARGLKAMESWLENQKHWTRPATTACTASLMFILFAYSFVEYWPRYLTPRYSNDYEQASRELIDLAKNEISEPAIILVNAEGSQNFRFSSAFPFNDIYQSNTVVFARDLEGKTDCLRAAFPEREFFRYVPGAESKGGSLIKVLP